MHHSQLNRTIAFKNIRIASSVVLVLLSNSGASSEAAKQDKAGAPIRLVSFAPSCSELIGSLNADNCLVGVCKFCELPSNENVQRVGDFTTANMEKLTQLKPDAILTVNGQESLTNSLTKNGFKVITLANTSMADISHNLIQLGALTKHSESATILVKNFEESVSELKALCNNGKSPTVFLCVWPQPLLTAGSTSFLNEAVTICGGNNIAASLKDSYPHFSQERLVIDNPEILIMPAEAQTTTFLKRAPWNNLRASKEHRIYFLDKGISDRLNRPSIEVVDGLYWLASKLHPELAKELSAWQSKTHVRLKNALANKHF